VIVRFKALSAGQVLRKGALVHREGLRGKEIDLAVKSV
jgi:hypothetical protein